MMISYGFLKGYTNWVYHGEGDPSAILDYDSDAYDDQDDMHGMLQDAFGITTLEGEMANLPNEHNEKPNAEAKKIYKLLMKLIKNYTLVVRNLAN